MRRAELARCILSQALGVTRILQSLPSVVLAAVVGALLTLIFSASERTTVIGRWQQPASIDYQSFDPCTLFLIEKQTGVFARVSHEIQIMRGGKPDEYGHSMEVELTSLQALPASALKASQVEWTFEGVAIAVPSGHRFFFPSRAFTGGR